MNHHPHGPMTTEMPDHGNHHHGGPDMGMGKMFFHIGYDHDILIYGWDANSTGRMIGTFIAVFLLAIGYEYIKFLRILLAQDFRSRSCPSGVLPPVDGEAAASDIPEHPSWFKKNLPHILQSLLYCFQVGVSFILMLLVMTFNIWIFLAVIFGMASGYFLFASATGGFKVEDCCN